MALSEIQKLQADQMALEVLVAAMGALAFGLTAKIDGFDSALNGLDRLENNLTQSLTNVLNDTPDAVEAGRRAEKVHSVALGTIRDALLKTDPRNAES